MSWGTSKLREYRCPDCDSEWTNAWYEVWFYDPKYGVTTEWKERGLPEWHRASCPRFHGRTYEKADAARRGLDGHVCRKKITAETS